MKSVFVVVGYFYNQDGEEYSVPLIACESYDQACDVAQSVQDRTHNIIDRNEWNKRIKGNTLSEIIKDFSSDYSMDQIELTYNCYVNDLNLVSTTKIFKIPFGKSNIKLWYK